VEIRHLKYFIAVAEELSFSRTAEKLHISQPPLSTQIKQLESELGVTLFHRDNKSISLSPQGLFFYQEAKKIVIQFDRLIYQTKNLHSSKKNITIGYVLPALINFLDALIEKLLMTYPEYNFQMKEYSSIKDFSALLQNRELDIAFLYPPILNPNVDFKVIYKEEVMAVLPENHHLAKRELIDMADLANEPIIAHPKEIAPELYDRLISACLEAGFYPNIVREATPQQARVRLSASGLGICFASKSIQRLNTPGAVFKSLITKYRADVPIALAWRKEDKYDLIDYIIDWCKINI
jgi:DNA-binding transcriptional LysR family regulator